MTEPPLSSPRREPEPAVRAHLPVVGRLKAHPDLGLAPHQEQVPEHRVRSRITLAIPEIKKDVMFNRGKK